MDKELKLMNYKEWLTSCENTDPCLIDQLLPEDSGEYALISGRTSTG